MKLILRIISSLLIIVPILILAQKASSSITFLFYLLLVVVSVYPIWAEKGSKLFTPVIIALRLWYLYLLSFILLFSCLMGSLFLGVVSPFIPMLVFAVFIHILPLSPLPLIFMRIYTMYTPWIFPKFNFTRPTAKPSSPILKREKKEDPVNKPSSSGLLPLFEAVLAQDIRKTEELIQNPMLDVNAIHSPTGNSALCVCCINGYEQIAKILLQHKSIDIHIKNNEGKTARDLSLERNYYAIAEMIERNIQ